MPQQSANTRALIDSTLFELKREEEVAEQRSYEDRRARAIGREITPLPGQVRDLDAAYGNAQDARQVAAELHEKILNGEGRNALPLQLRYLQEVRETIQMGVTASTSTANQQVQSAAAIATNAGERLTAMSENYIDQIPPQQIDELNRYARTMWEPGGPRFELGMLTTEQGVGGGPQVFGASIAYLAMQTGRDVADTFAQVYSSTIGTEDQQSVQDMWSEAQRAETADLGTFETLQNTYNEALDTTTTGLRGLGVEGRSQLGRAIEALENLQENPALADDPDSPYLTQLVEFADQRLENALAQTPGPVSLEWIRQQIRDTIEADPARAAELLGMHPDSGQEALSRRLEQKFTGFSRAMERENDRRMSEGEEDVWVTSGEPQDIPPQPEATPTEAALEALDGEDAIEYRMQDEAAVAQQDLMSQIVSAAQAGDTDTVARLSAQLNAEEEAAPIEPEVPAEAPVDPKEQVEAALLESQRVAQEETPVLDAEMEELLDTPEYGGEELNAIAPQGREHRGLVVTPGGAHQEDPSFLPDYTLRERTPEGQLEEGLYGFDDNGRPLGAPTDVREGSPEALDRIPQPPVEAEDPQPQTPPTAEVTGGLPEGAIAEGTEGWADYSVYPDGTVRYQERAGGPVRTFSRRGDPEAYNSMVEKAFDGQDPITPSASEGSFEPPAGLSGFGEGQPLSEVENLTPAPIPTEEPAENPVVEEVVEEPVVEEPVVEETPSELNGINALIMGVDTRSPGHTGNLEQSIRREFQEYEESPERPGDWYPTSDVSMEVPPGESPQQGHTGNAGETPAIPVETSDVSSEVGMGQSQYTANDRTPEENRALIEEAATPVFETSEQPVNPLPNENISMTVPARDMPNNLMPNNITTPPNLGSASATVPGPTANAAAQKRVQYLLAEQGRRTAEQERQRAAGASISSMAPAQ